MARDSWDEDDREELRDARRRRRRRRHRSGPLLSDDERAYREATRRAKRRIGFFSHLIAYAGVIMLLSIEPGGGFARFVAVGWGIGLAFHYFGTFVAPDLRKRIIHHEVERRVASDVSRERRALENRHVRSLEDLSAQVAHEIRNPITAAKSLVQQMGEDPTSAENVGYAKVALEELDRVERSVAHLLRYAREEDLRLADLSLGSVIDSALETLRDRIAAQRVRLVREEGHGGAVRGDAEKLRRVVINLVGNALDAFEERRPADPTLEVQDGENLAGTECWLRVRDNGPGMDASKIAQIWSPFFSSKASGTGLGLAIAKKVVEAHGGTIEVESRPGAGAEFTITLPKSHAEGRA
ncbi:MAG TPA: ATP-binding protein [Myxococcota bacterium]|nr:ATP-binding protein [Myxococcota bacterium]